jgi:hypothetical protein
MFQVIALIACVYSILFSFLRIHGARTHVGSITSFYRGRTQIEGSHFLRRIRFFPNRGVGINKGRNLDAPRTANSERHPVPFERLAAPSMGFLPASPSSDCSECSDRADACDDAVTHMTLAPISFPSSAICAKK